MRHVTWFLAAVENFRFLDLRIHPMADPEAAAAEIRAEALIKATGRTYRQEYVVFLRCKDRQDHAPSRVLRSRARRQGAGCADFRCLRLNRAGWTTY